MRFVATTRRDWISTKENGNFEQQFSYSGLFVNTKRVVKMFFLLSKRFCSFFCFCKRLLNVLHGFRGKRSMKTKASGCTALRGFSEFILSFSSLLAPVVITVLEPLHSHNPIRSFRETRKNIFSRTKKSQGAFPLS